MKVRFCSPSRVNAGYSEIGRIVASQVISAGHELSFVEIPLLPSEEEATAPGATAARSAEDTGTPDINIVNMIPPLYSAFSLPGTRNIGYAMFEADSLPAGWAAHCNRMDAIWVPSDWLRQVFTASGVTVPISVVGPHAEPTSTDTPSSGPFRLFSMFQWSARKNPINMLRAYCAAFDGNRETVLTMKINAGNNAQSASLVQEAINNAMSRTRARQRMPRIEVATNEFSVEQLALLHASSHAYISLSHSEAWGQPAWDATIAGKPVIHTGWSSPMEYLHAQGLVRHNMAPVYGMEDFAPYYHIGMNWAEPHLDDAVAKLRDLYASHEKWANTALEHREKTLERFSLSRRVQIIERALQAAR